MYNVFKTYFATEDYFSEIIILLDKQSCKKNLILKVKKNVYTLHVHAFFDWELKIFFWVHWNNSNDNGFESKIVFFSNIKYTMCYIIPFLTPLIIQ